MEEFTELAKLINKDLDTHEGMIIPAGGPDLDMVKSKLTAVIQYMLLHQFEKLCNAMYRLDVSEKKFHEVLTGSKTEEIASSLADLVIERELQKVRTRIMSRKGEE